MRAKPQKPPNSKLLKGIIKCVNPLLQWDAPSWDKMIQVFQERAHESLGTKQLKHFLFVPGFRFRAQIIVRPPSGQLEKVRTPLTKNR